MKLVIGSDHGGFEMKERLKKFLQEQGHEVADFGCYSGESADYPDPALLVAEAVTRREFERGILLDGFGGAVAFAANKVPGARAVCAYDLISAEFAAAHENCNILCLGGKTIGELTLKKILSVWLSTPFEGGRHQKRLDKVVAIERRYLQ
ncbi:MAG: RpiB/LacA/LacB family sugar-phosphate isomerase [Elusimicrobiales bacterium]|nr:RpiB/LacA/LacB family sugar-phosphate isomerase [Elusimicrobiales bacterium]